MLQGGDVTTGPFLFLDEFEWVVPLYYFISVSFSSHFHRWLPGEDWMREKGKDQVDFLGGHLSRAEEISIWKEAVGLKLVNEWCILTEV